MRMRAENSLRCLPCSNHAENCKKNNVRVRLVGLLKRPDLPLLQQHKIVLNRWFKCAKGGTKYDDPAGGRSLSRGPRV